MNPDKNNIPEYKKLDVEFTIQFSNRFLKIAQMADKGDDYGYGKALADLQVDIMGFIRKKVENQKKIIRESYFCCKYQTVNPKDFCDHCLSLTKKE